MAKDEKKDRKETRDRVIAANPAATHEYLILERLEAGVVLLGTEIKAARQGQMSIKEAFVVIKNEEPWLMSCHIGAYANAGYASHEPLRPRKLLLHKREVRKLHGKLTLRGYTIVPLKAYTKDGRLKLEIGLAQGKKLHDKRAAERQKGDKKEIRAHLSG